MTLKLLRRYERARGLLLGQQENHEELMSTVVIYEENTSAVRD